MQYKMNDDGQMRIEDVTLNYRDKYIKIVAPGTDGNTPITVMYDIDKVFPQFSIVITTHFSV